MRDDGSRHLTGAAAKGLRLLRWRRSAQRGRAPRLLPWWRGPRAFLAPLISGDNQPN